MKSLDKGQDKIKKICDVLKNETLEPAMKEAEKILEDAKRQAAEIVQQAEKQAKDMHQAARRQVEQEQSVFQSSMQQAAKQSIEALRQHIENKLFNEELNALIEHATSDPQIIAKLIDAIIKAIDKDGIDANISVIIPKNVPMKSITALLGENVVKRLKNETLVIGGFAGGAQVKLEGKMMTIDISDMALKELMSTYARKDFRQLLFK